MLDNKKPQKIIIIKKKKKEKIKGIAWAVTQINSISTIGNMKDIKGNSLALISLDEILAHCHINYKLNMDCVINGERHR